MEVHSHGLETLGVNKEAEKVFNPELKDILAPPSSQIPAGEDFTVISSAHPLNVPVKDEGANNSVGVDSNAALPATCSFPPATSDLNSAPDVNFQPFESVGVEPFESVGVVPLESVGVEPFESVGVEQNSQHEIHQVGEQDEVFDDMVMLENDVVTSASLSGGPDALQVTDIQMEEFHEAPVSDMHNAPPVVADAAVVEAVEVNVAEIIEHPSDVQAAPASVIVTDVTIVSTVVQEVPVVESTEVTVLKPTSELSPSMEGGVPAAPTSDGLEANVPEVTKAAETVNLTAPDGGTRHEATDEEIQAIKGQKVVKKFGRKNFGGEVVDFDPETKWFKVVYEDGDEEDLELWEVKQILASLSNASSSKKRPRVEGGADESSQKSPKKPKKTGAESTAKKSRSGFKSTAKSPKTPGIKAKGSKSANKSSGSKRAKSPGKLIKKALNSSAFKTPINLQVNEGKGKGKAGTLTPKSTKGGSTKKTQSGKVSRSLNLQTPKSQKKGKDQASTENFSSKKAMKSSGPKRKADQGETSLGKMKRSKNIVTEAGGGDSGLVGKQVKKDFGGTLYDGVVVKYDKKTQFYKVKYADGDQEDLEMHELEPILISVQDLENTEEKDDKPAKLSSLSSLMSAENVSGTEKRK